MRTCTDSPVSTCPPATPILSVVSPDITDESSVFLFKVNPPYSIASYILMDFTLVILPFCSHFTLFPLYTEPFPSPYKYFFHPKNKWNLPTNFIFPCSVTTHFSSLCNSKIPRVLSIPAVTNAFPPLSLWSQAFLITSPLQLLWSRASVITPLNLIISSQPSSSWTFCNVWNKSLLHPSDTSFIFLLGN